MTVALNPYSLVAAEEGRVGVDASEDVHKSNDISSHSDDQEAMGNDLDEEHMKADSASKPSRKWVVNRSGQVGRKSMTRTPRAALELQENQFIKERIQGTQNRSPHEQGSILHHQDEVQEDSRQSVWISTENNGQNSVIVKKARTKRGPSPAN